MRASFLEKPNQISIKNTPKPEPKTGEVRIKLHQVGICGSDIHLFQGHRAVAYPLTIGHEGLGFIDTIGEGVEGRTIGERVVIEPNIPCGNCRYCLRGQAKICIHKRTIGLTEAGCFAEYLTVPAAFAHTIPPSVTDADAVTIEPMSVAYHAINLSKTKVGDAIAVIGLGAIGLLVAHLALRLGYKVFVTEINESKVKLIENQGAIPVCPVGTIEEQTAILSQTWFDNDVRAVFECAGTTITTNMTAAAAPRGSNIILLGLSEKPAQFIPLKIVREGITIIPSLICDHPVDFRNVIQLIAAKVIEPSFIVSQYIPLDDLQKGLEWASKGHESKVVVTI
ncbi:MAG: alcohol dehydrogenase catalytic domain-containing protein [Saprospiraceae bacterium]|nr:alcohol dehydrogenase catalytic domain-containing protein [Saprospiraceae bacterium]